MKLYCTTFFILFLMLTVNCDDLKYRQIHDERILLSQSHMQFTFNLLSNIIMTNGYNLKTHQLESLVFSPLSIQSLLLMIHLGSKGHTNAQIAKLLYIDRMNKSNFSRIHSIFGESVRSLFEDKEVAKYLSIANQLFVNKDLKIRGNYEMALKHIHGTSLRSVDFSSPKLIEQINDWVWKTTKGTIENFLSSPLSPITSLVAMNAIFFKGDWLYKFDEHDTQNAFFQLTNGKRVRVPMMVGKFPIAYGEINDPFLQASIVELPYKVQRLGLFVILPNDLAPNGILNMMRSLNSTSFTRLITCMKKSKKGEEVNIRLPRFEIRSKPDLTTIFRNNLGLRSLFNGGEADFTPMFEIGVNSPSPSLSQFSHQALLQINENGSLAGAASATMVERIGLFNAIYFEAERPFMFFLTDKQSGLILFAGVYGGPKVE